MTERSHVKRDQRDGFQVSRVPSTFARRACPQAVKLSITQIQNKGECTTRSTEHRVTTVTASIVTARSPRYE